MSNLVRPQPRIDVINKVMEKLQQMFSEIKPSTEELALIGLTTLRAMHEHGQEKRIAYPKSMTIQTPDSRYNVTFTISRNPNALIGATEIPIISPNGVN